MPQAVDTSTARIPTSAAVRDAALMRMRKLNSRHGTLAWDLRNGPDALGPHAVTLLYLAPGPTGAQEVFAAWRLFRDADDVRDLPALLAELTTAATAKLNEDGPYDPRLHLAHRYDKMPHTAPFVGFGVSSLDTPTGGLWVDVRNTRHLSALDIIGRSRIVLSDGSQLMLDRGGKLGNMGTIYADSVLDMTSPVSVIQPYRSLVIPPADQTIWQMMSGYGAAVSAVTRAFAAGHGAVRRMPRQRNGAGHVTHRATR